MLTAETFRWEMDPKTRVVTAIRPNGERLSSRLERNGRDAAHDRTPEELVRLHVLARNAEDFIRRVDQE